MSHNSRPLNSEIIEIMPMILGGSPTDPKNKSTITRENHFKYVRYWNQIISEQRKKKSTRRGNDL